jgi:hypothetical protein
MKHRYEPPTDPAAWAYRQAQGTGDPYRDSPTIIPRAATPPTTAMEEFPDEARAVGLHRMSRLTWRATEISAVAAVGIVTLFVRTAPAQPASHVTYTPPVKPITACPSPGHSPAHSASKHRHKVAGATAPGGAQAAAQTGQSAAGSPGSSGSSGSSGASGGSGSASSAPAPAPAPPSSAPAPAPPPPAASPPPTTSSGSKGGG